MLKYVSDWAHSKTVLHGIRIAEVRVRFPVSPQINLISQSIKIVYKKIFSNSNIHLKHIRHILENVSYIKHCQLNLQCFIINLIDFLFRLE